MRHALVLVGLVACTRAEPTAPAVVSGSAAVVKVVPIDAPVPSRSGVAVPPNPPAISVIGDACVHSNMPWGDGVQRQSRIVDLDAGTITFDSSDTPNTPKGGPVPLPPPPPRGHAGLAPDAAPAPRARVVALPPARIATIRAAVATLLAGGPYEPELPPSEGTPCTLTLAAAGAAQPFFTIDKAFRANKDAVSALLDLL